MGLRAALDKLIAQVKAERMSPNTILGLYATFLLLTLTEKLAVTTCKTDFPP